MKKMYSEKRFIYMLAVIMILAGSVITAYAANPSGYASLHGDIGRAGKPDSDGYYSTPTVVVEGYMQNFRVFVPPGTASVFLVIYEYGYQKAIARFKIPRRLRSYHHPLYRLQLP